MEEEIIITIIIIRRRRRKGEEERRKANRLGELISMERGRRKNYIPFREKGPSLLSGIFFFRKLDSCLRFEGIVFRILFFSFFISSRRGFEMAKGRQADRQAG